MSRANASPKFRNEGKWEVEADDVEVQGKTYDSNKYISKARRVTNGTVPINILQFQYPFSVVQLLKESLNSLPFLFEPRKCSLVSQWPESYTNIL